GKSFQAISHYDKVKQAIEECRKVGKAQYRNQGLLNNQYRISSVRLSKYPVQDREKILVTVTDETKLANIFQGLAHDMKYPLGMVLHSLKNAITRVERKMSYESIRKDLDLIHAGIINYQTFVLSINARTHFDMSKKNIWKDGESEEELISLNKVIDEISELYSISITALGVDLKFKVEGQIKLFAHQKTFEAVLRNLLSNAIKATERAEKSVVELTAREEENYAVIEISDNGQGMDKEKQQKLFDLSSQFGGTGAYIVACFIAEENGEIDIQSPGKFGAGTTITLRIPNQ
ncbi:MAG: HAMP domain-containing sensor histidine kinase, partial [Bacteroidota bacterium]